MSKRHTPTSASKTARNETLPSSSSSTQHIASLMSTPNLAINSNTFSGIDVSSEKQEILEGNDPPFWFNADSNHLFRLLQEADPHLSLQSQTQLTGLGIELPNSAEFNPDFNASQSLSFLHALNLSTQNHTASQHPTPTLSSFLPHTSDLPLHNSNNSSSNNNNINIRQGGTGYPPRDDGDDTSESSSSTAIGNGTKASLDMKDGDSLLYDMDSSSFSGVDTTGITNGLSPSQSITSTSSSSSSANARTLPAKKKVSTTTEHIKKAALLGGRAPTAHLVTSSAKASSMLNAKVVKKPGKGAKGAKGGKPTSGKGNPASDDDGRAEKAPKRRHTNNRRDTPETMKDKAQWVPRVPLPMHQTKEGKRQKGKGRRKQPTREEFESDEAFASAWAEWRSVRERNNAAVQRSREKAKVRREQDKQALEVREREFHQLKSTIETLQKNVGLLIKACKDKAELSQLEEAWVATLTNSDAGVQLATQCALFS